MGRKCFVAVLLIMVMVPAKNIRAEQRPYDAIKSIQIGKRVLKKSSTLGGGAKAYVKCQMFYNQKKGKLKVTPKKNWKIQKMRILKYNDTDDGDALEDGVFVYGKRVKNGKAYTFGKYDTFLGVDLKNTVTKQIMSCEIHWRTCSKVLVRYGKMKNKKTYFKINNDSFTYSKKVNWKKDASKFKSKKQLVTLLKDMYGYSAIKVNGKVISIYIPRSRGSVKVSMKNPGKGTSIKLQS